MAPSTNKPDEEARHSKMNKPISPENGDDVAEKVGAKRQRRPSVRLGEIGGYVSSDSNRKVVKSQGNGKQVAVSKIKESNKNVGAKKSGGDGVAEKVGGGEKEGKKSFTKRIRSNLVSVEDKAGDEFRVSDSESPVDSGENLEIEKQGKSDRVEIGRLSKIAATKRVRTDRVSVEKFSGGKDVEFRVSDSESSEREESPVNLEIENGDQVGNGGRGVRKGGDGPLENGDEERNGVKGWLNQLGLGRYGPVFDVHEVDEEVLPLLTLEDLKDMGINAVGSRRKIFAYIQKLRE
ncbi:hypothetical protein DCAR_0518714 [Daucus carota subsp. sativus]|uniref:SAM domain-containing protein n=1 Tax=Daucus carota subsp. sativus TaxID=79200 RepID=A0A161ZXV9_DAUCS|nr:PREDICTED: ankyrin repeat and SAM domain-containing protein 6-like [Daucus carota subsp. sativus]WOG99366.1 hypothetical protein DCAR_0518714 [Daucus carota subsp. sativus]